MAHFKKDGTLDKRFKNNGGGGCAGMLLILCIPFAALLAIIL